MDSAFSCYDEALEGGDPEPSPNSSQPNSALRDVGLNHSCARWQRNLAFYRGAKQTLCAIHAQHCGKEGERPPHFLFAPATDKVARPRLINLDQYHQEAPQQHCEHLLVSAASGYPPVQLLGDLLDRLLSEALGDHAFTLIKKWHVYWKESSLNPSISYMPGYF